MYKNFENEIRFNCCFRFVNSLALVDRVSAYVVGQSPSLIAQSVRPDACTRSNRPRQLPPARSLIIFFTPVSVFLEDSQARRQFHYSIICMYVELSKLTVVE